jgi:hypothetical protein
MAGTTFTVANVFALVGQSVGPYFIRRTVEVTDDDKNVTRMTLTDFVLRCIAEKMAERWAPEEEVKSALEGKYEDEVMPTGVMGGLKSISGGAHRRKTRRQGSLKRTA